MEKEFTVYPEIGALYDHYKGGKYQVIALAKHTETGEVEVVYKSIHFGSVHVRPLHMWFETVKNHEGRMVGRFKLSEK